MLQFHAHTFIHRFNFLVGTEHVLAEYTANADLQHIKTIQDQNIKDRIIVAVEAIESECKKFKIEPLDDEVAKFLNILKMDNITISYIKEQKLLTNLKNLIIYQLQSILFFHIPTHRAEYYNNLSNWQVVIDRYPNLITNIDESGKCLALGRYTASVYHLALALETGVQELGTICSINSRDQVWGKITKAIQDYVDNNIINKKLKEHWTQVLAYLNNVRIAWRNTTMHPKNTYTEDEAIAIYAALRSFMIDMTTKINDKLLTSCGSQDLI